MALTWLWGTDKIGSLKWEDRIGQEWECSLYSGNALYIVIYEYKDEGEDMYQVVDFAADKDHLKNMLGLNKGYDNIFLDKRWKEIKLDTQYKGTQTIVQLLAKAKIPITISLY